MDGISDNASSMDGRPVHTPTAHSDQTFDIAIIDLRGLNSGNQMQEIELPTSNKISIMENEKLNVINA